MLDSVPLLPSGTSFQGVRGRRVRQPTSTGPPTTGAGHGLRERLGPEKSFTSTHDGPHVDVRPLNSAGACTVIVSGEIDSLTAPGLRDCLLDVLGRPRLLDARVEVDLSRVTFLNAAGLTALARAHQMADITGRVLRIRCGTARAVLRPLQITGLWHTFNVIEQGPRERKR